VTFLEGAATLGTGTLSGSGLVATTSFSTNGLSGGSHTITASYPVNSSISLLSSSNTCTQTVSSVIVITTQPVSAVVAVGQPASLSVANTGATPYHYQWLKDGGILTGQTNATLTYAAFQFTNSGNYQVVITNTQGMAISRPAFLSMTNAPLRAWGHNDAGQLGNGTSVNTNLPVSVASNVVAVAAGQDNSMFVKADGTLWVMGVNLYGQLGNGTTVATNLPVSVASNVVAVAAGQGHSLFVKADGTLWAMGDNNYGQLGNGTTNNSSLPVSVASNVVAVAAGMDHSMFVKADGTLWAMGNNSYGDLGNGTTVNTNRPVSVASNVVAVAAGALHSLFVKADGTLWAVGYNYQGMLGDGTAITRSNAVSVASDVVAVAAGNTHSMFVKADGTLWAMGDNSYGALGNGTTVNTNRPVSVASNVVAVAAGARYSMFVKADGTLWAMGYNYYGELGNGSTMNTNWPVCVVGLSVASLGAIDKADHSLTVAGMTPQTSGLTNQTITAGQSFTFSITVTNGDGPFTYQWQLNGSNIVGATNASYTVASATVANAGTYMVTVAGFVGSTSQSATLTVNKAVATVTLGSLAQTYTGSALNATATTTPTNLAVNLTYNGNVNAPTNVGSYTVIGTVVDANYYGSAANTLVINSVTNLVAAAMNLSVPAGQTAALPLAKLLLRSTDPFGQTLRVVSADSASANGGAVVLGASEIDYTPANGFTGTDTFGYVIADTGGNTASGIINVTVTLSGSGSGGSYNQLSVQPIGSDVRLSYLGIPGTNYALEVTHALTPPITWTPVVTNPAAANGLLLFTNTPGDGQSFYRTRYVP
jgi:alpha-tubulin suppressor-like RCC1 family protein